MPVVDLDRVAVGYPGFEARWGLEHGLWAAQGNSIEHNRKAEKIDISGFGTRVKSALTGMQEGTLKIKGLADMEKGELQYWLNQWFGRKSEILAWYALAGLEFGSAMTMQPSSIIDSSISAKLKDALDFSLELDARGAYNDGLILLSPYDLLVPGDAGFGSVDDNTTLGGATTTGAAAQLHVIGYEGGTDPSVTVDVEHSADGVTYLPLMSFDAQVGVGAQRKTVPTTTTVNAHVRASYTFDGDPDAVQVVLGFARGVDLKR